MKLTRLLALLPTILLLNSCMIHSRIDLGPPTPQASPSPSPQANAQGPITLVCDEKCTSTERKKIKEVEKKLNETLMSKCLEDYLFSSERSYNMLEGSPKEMLEKMREPSIMLVNYYSGLNIFVLGYEVGGESVVHLNRLAVAYYGFDICDEASVAVHEASHAKGFMHKGNSPNSFNQKTVPYTLNHAFDKGPGNGGCCK